MTGTDDYWQRCQYDDDLIQDANLELTMLRNEGECHEQ